jgi:hypothetical protein
MKLSILAGITAIIATTVAAPGAVSTLYSQPTSYPLTLRAGVPQALLRRQRRPV